MKVRNRNHSSVTKVHRSYVRAVLVRAHCALCGGDLGMRRVKPSGLYFHHGHSAQYYAAEREHVRLGRFLKLYQGYQGFASAHYRDPDLPLHNVRNFLAVLEKEKVTNINRVSVEHIGHFKAQYRGQAGRADLIKVFFDYLILNKLYRKPNPVRPRLHYEKEHRSAPRIYEGSDIADMWRQATKSGSTRAILSLAFAIEFGPTVGEVLAMRVQDVKWSEGIIWLRKPNPRPGEEEYSHYAPYWHKTACWLNKWLKERPEDCGHDYLLTNDAGGPMKSHTFWRLLKSALVKPASGHRAQGMGEVSYVRLRDTNIAHLREAGMKDNVNMQIHGILAVATIKRFDALLTEEELEEFYEAED